MDSWEHIDSCIKGNDYHRALSLLLEAYPVVGYHNLRSLLIQRIRNIGYRLDGTIIREAGPCQKILSSYGKGSSKKRK